MKTTAAVVVAAALALPAIAQVRPAAGMLRWPDVSKTDICFVYANDIWIVPRAGGVAAPLASPRGQEAFPKFSADGKTVAFAGNYDGNRDLYTMAVEGGAARRVTHHPAGESLADWTPDGRLLFMFNGLSGLARQQQLWTVSSEGGLPEKVPVPYGGFGSISPDGNWLAYTFHSTDTRTWKRYRGGMATDVWLFNLKTNASRRLTDWEGTDTIPMFIPGGDGTRVYYVSDEGPEHRLNIWSCDVKSGKRTQVTKFADNDVKWPSSGPGVDGKGEIIFQLGSELRLLDVGTGKDAAIRVMIPGDRPAVRDRSVDASKYITSSGISPTGKRVVVTARGDVWTLPAKEGVVRNLTHSDSVFEHSPAYSPDGKWIAYISDEGGEYELYVRPSDARAEEKKDDDKDEEKAEGEEAKPEPVKEPVTKESKEPRKLTSWGVGYRYSPQWSPDSKWITTSDHAGRLFLTDAASGETKTIDTDPWSNPMGTSWASDSNWFAYIRGDDEDQNGCIWVYNVATGKAARVTSPMFNTTSVTFDRKGDYLYFASNRAFSGPIYGDQDTTFVYNGTAKLYAVPLRDDMKSPLAPKSDEEPLKKDEAKKDDEKKDEKKDDDKKEEEKDDAAKPDEAKKDDAKADDEKKDEDKKDDKAKKDDKKKDVKIDLDGFERRAVVLPPGAGSFGGLSVADGGKLLYVRQPAPRAEGGSVLKVFDVSADEKKEETVVGDIQGYDLSADGKKILVVKSANSAQIVNPESGGGKAQAVPIAGMNVTIRPREEWKQIFRDTWRLQRDYFYEPTLHGVDWPKIVAHYQKMLDDAVTREDVAFIQAEIISELNVGHAYVTSPGDVEQGPSVNVGMLGCDFELVKTGDNAAYRIKRIYEGGAWDADARGPLSQPGVKVKEGDFLLAVGGVPINTAKDPWAAFLGTAGRTITITVGPNPVIDEESREVVVTPEGGEGSLRYRAYIESKRRYVEEKTKGQVGYIYVPNTGVDGQDDLYRQFVGQRGRAALIIDERWNGGGQIPTRFIELLNRPATNYWAKRDGGDWSWPPDAHFGPKCMLINGLAGSGGDMFPWLFKHNKLGPTIGTRTWGGLVGISGNPGLIDGGSISVPTFGFYETDGTWGVEGHGVDPDIEVIDDPALMTNGGDPQLDKAIELMLAEIKDRPYKKPTRPASPNRSGMGLGPNDR